MRIWIHNTGFSDLYPNRLSAVLRITEDPDPVIFKDPDPAIYLSKDPDPAIYFNTDQDRVLPSHWK